MPIIAINILVFVVCKVCVFVVNSIQSQIFVLSIFNREKQPQKAPVWSKIKFAVLYLVNMLQGEFMFWPGIFFSWALWLLSLSRESGVGLLGIIWDFI